MFSTQPRGKWKNDSSQTSRFSYLDRDFKVFEFLSRYQVLLTTLSDPKALICCMPFKIDCVKDIIEPLVMKIHNSLAAGKKDK